MNCELDALRELYISEFGELEKLGFYLLEKEYFKEDIKQKIAEDFNSYFDKLSNKMIKCRLITADRLKQLNREKDMQATFENELTSLRKANAETRSELFKNPDAFANFIYQLLKVKMLEQSLEDKSIIVERNAEGKVVFIENKSEPKG